MFDIFRAIMDEELAIDILTERNSNGEKCSSILFGKNSSGFI